jgi:hypothetical protein
MVMNAYLFVAGITQSEIRPPRLGTTQTAGQPQVWDSCTSSIVCGENPASAQRDFEACLQGRRDAEHPVQVEIKRLVAAQFLEPLLSESGHKPIDWRQINQHVEAALQSAEGDGVEQCLEQGYWADANQLVRPDRLSADVASLQRDLPEEIRSGLNWSVDKQFFFIVSVLSPPALPAEPDYERESGRAGPDGTFDEAQPTELDPVVAALPELRDKEVAALVQARNSLLAAWLWRRFAKDTQFVNNDIHIHPWCGVLVSEANPAIPDEPS